jgi:O-methyltransferase
MFRKIVDRIGAWAIGEEDYRYFQYKRAKKIARRQGYEIYKSQLIWMCDPDFVAARDEVARRGIIGIPNDRCYMLQHLAARTRDVPGDVAECGVRFGKSSYFILSGLGKASEKQYEIFDSFEGLSKPGAGDEEDGSSVWERGELAVAEDRVRINLAGFEDRLQFHKGWIPDRFEDVKNKRFSFVHVDVDLYEPTRDSVAFFFPRISKGGILVCDDYGSAYCPGAKKAVDEFFHSKPERVMALPTGQAIVFKE